MSLHQNTKAANAFTFDTKTKFTSRKRRIPPFNSVPSTNIARSIQLNEQGMPREAICYLPKSIIFSLLDVEKYLGDDVSTPSAHRTNCEEMPLDSKWADSFRALVLFGPIQTQSCHFQDLERLGLFAFTSPWPRLRFLFAVFNFGRVHSLVLFFLFVFHREFALLDCFLTFQFSINSARCNSINHSAFPTQITANTCASKAPPTPSTATKQQYAHYSRLFAYELRHRLFGALFPDICAIPMAP